MLRGRPAAVISIASLTAIAVTLLVAFGTVRGIELALRDAALRG